MIHIALVVAVAENDVIGVAGGLPWRIADDLKWFKSVTMAKPIIMGRKTFQSIGKPLPGRRNFVVTRSPDFHPPGVETAPSIDDALNRACRAASELGVDEIAVIGGAEIYELALPRADRIYLTRVHAHPVGDAYFRHIDSVGSTAGWDVTRCGVTLQDPDHKDGGGKIRNQYACTHYRLDRIGGASVDND